MALNTIEACLRFQAELQLLVIAFNCKGDITHAAFSLHCFFSLLINNSKINKKSVELNTREHTLKIKHLFYYLVRCEPAMLVYCGQCTVYRSGVLGFS